MPAFRTLKLSNDTYNRVEGLAKLHGSTVPDFLERVLGKVINDAMGSLTNTVVGGLPRKLWLETMVREGGNVITVIKEVRTLTGLGLKEAKDLVDHVRDGRGPKEICTFDPDRCQLSMQYIQGAGAVISIR